MNKTAAYTRSQLLRQQQNWNESAGPDQAPVDYEFPDGWSIRRLNTPHAECYEGELMGNCVGSFDSLTNSVPEDRWHQEDPSGYYGNGYYSIRDPDNLPHGTFYTMSDEYAPTSFWDLDLEGRSGSNAAKYAPYVHDWWVNKYGGHPVPEEEWEEEYGMPLTTVGSPLHEQEEADKFQKIHLSGFWHPDFVERMKDEPYFEKLKRAVKPMQKFWDRLTDGEDLELIKDEARARLSNNFKNEDVEYMIDDLERDYKEWKKFQDDEVGKYVRKEFPEFYWMYGQYGPEVFNVVKKMQEAYKSVHWNHPSTFRNQLIASLIQEADVDPTDAEMIADQWANAHLQAQGIDEVSEDQKIKDRIRRAEVQWKNKTIPQMILMGMQGGEKSLEEATSKLLEAFPHSEKDIKDWAAVLDLQLRRTSISSVSLQNDGFSDSSRMANAFADEVDTPYFANILKNWVDSFPLEDSNLTQLDFSPVEKSTSSKFESVKLAFRRLAEDFKALVGEKDLGGAECTECGIAHKPGPCPKSMGGPMEVPEEPSQEEFFEWAEDNPVDDDVSAEDDPGNDGSDEREKKEGKTANAINVVWVADDGVDWDDNPLVTTNVNQQGALNSFKAELAEWTPGSSNPERKFVGVSGASGLTIYIAADDWLHHAEIESEVGSGSVFGVVRGPYVTFDENKPPDVTMAIQSALGLPDVPAMSWREYATMDESFNPFDDSGASKFGSTTKVLWVDENGNVLDNGSIKSQDESDEYSGQSFYYIPEYDEVWAGVSTDVHHYHILGTLDRNGRSVTPDGKLTTFLSGWTRYKRIVSDNLGEGGEHKLDPYARKITDALGLPPVPPITMSELIGESDENWSDDPHFSKTASVVQPTITWVHNRVSVAHDAPDELSRPVCVVVERPVNESGEVSGPANYLHVYVGEPRSYHADMIHGVPELRNVYTDENGSSFDDAQPWELSQAYEHDQLDEQWSNPEGAKRFIASGRFIIVPSKGKIEKWDFYHVGLVMNYATYSTTLTDDEIAAVEDAIIDDAHAKGIPDFIDYDKNFKFGAQLVRSDRFDENMDPASHYDPRAKGPIESIRRPLIFDPMTETVYVGGQGEYHADLLGNSWTPASVKGLSAENKIYGEAYTSSDDLFSPSSPMAPFTPATLEFKDGVAIYWRDSENFEIHDDYSDAREPAPGVNQLVRDAILEAEERIDDENENLKFGAVRVQKSRLYDVAQDDKSKQYIRNRRPVIFDPNTETLIIGGWGEYHQDLQSELGVERVPDASYRPWNDKWGDNKLLFYGEAYVTGGDFRWPMSRKDIDGVAVYWQPVSNPRYPDQASANWEVDANGEKEPYPGINDLVRANIGEMPSEDDAEDFHFGSSEEMRGDEHSLAVMPPLTRQSPNDAFYYHVSPTTNRESIYENGLQPQEDKDQRQWRHDWNQPAGVYLYDSMENARAFASWMGYRNPHVDYDIWEARLPAGTVLHADPENSFYEADIHNDMVQDYWNGDVSSDEDFDGISSLYPHWQIPEDFDWPQIGDAGERYTSPDFWTLPEAHRKLEESNKDMNRHIPDPSDHWSLQDSWSVGSDGMRWYIEGSVPPDVLRIVDTVDKDWDDDPEREHMPRPMTYVPWKRFVGRVKKFIPGMRLDDWDWDRVSADQAV